MDNQSANPDAIAQLTLQVQGLQALLQPLMGKQAAPGISRDMRVEQMALDFKIRQVRNARRRRKQL